ncbi:hypothetical protein [Neokomagataea anthophila]|uniref:Uncharacterized protein n=1 Tax=Neokomagataea anthophila TaxID=2826925 RepID=A0ABS5E7F6_9PROT|nr:hypothetical protein [Neokomagataea anthophila]MBR0559741.1 hypothetical protein [Neokomagataea anthophila]
MTDLTEINPPGFDELDYDGLNYIRFSEKNNEYCEKLAVFQCFTAHDSLKWDESYKKLSELNKIIIEREGLYKKLSPLYRSYHEEIIKNR